MGAAATADMARWEPVVPVVARVIQHVKGLAEGTPDMTMRGIAGMRWSGGKYDEYDEAIDDGGPCDIALPLAY